MRKAVSPALVILFAALLIIQSTISAFAGISFKQGQGVVLTGADGVVLTGADGVVLTGADGVVLTGADGVVLTGADGVVLTGADALTYTGEEGVVLTGADSAGIRSFDPELAWLLNTLPDSSAVNVFVVFHRMPAPADFDALRAAGIFGGTIFNNLPMVMVNATRSQIAAISTLQSVRTIYSNKTFEFFTHDTRVITGETKVITDRALTQRNGGAPLSGSGVTVAVLDTGIDATHPDLSYGSQVVQNARVVDFQSSSPAFLYPQVVEEMSDSDQVMGHGTFVAGVIAGTGAASSGYYGGMAPGARLLGVSGGDASLFFVLSGIDYILSHRVDMNIRVVNCSFGISGLFDANDPINIATRILHDAGVAVVFSAGNRGSQPNSLNPYSVASWVIGVGSCTKGGSLSSFSSRGAAGYGMYNPTLVAPGSLGLPAFNKTGVTINDPAPGSWTINIISVGDPTAGASQRLVVAVEIFRANYSVTGLDGLSSSERLAATRAIRTGLITAPTGDFAGGWPATRLDVARAVMLGAGARVPQYLPDSPSFTDEPGDGAIFIESVVHSPFGDLMSTTGTLFNPRAQVDRVAVAVALVKVLGLEQETQAASVNNPSLADWNSIPPAARGYVSLAVSRNLMRASFGSFHPFDSITRVDLAAAAVALQRATR